MTNLERARQFLTDWSKTRPVFGYAILENSCTFHLASIFDSLEQAAYERGVTDGQALAALNQQTKGD